MPVLGAFRLLLDVVWSQDVKGSKFGYDWGAVLDVVSQL